MNRSIKLSLASSRQICECMVFADLIASSSYVSVVDFFVHRSDYSLVAAVSKMPVSLGADAQTSTPYLVQPLFVAG